MVTARRWRRRHPLWKRGQSPLWSVNLEADFTTKKGRHRPRKPSSEEAIHVTAGCLCLNEENTIGAYTRHFAALLNLASVARLSLH